MVSISDDRAESKYNRYVHRLRLQIDENLTIDTEQMFRLMDSILPFEACLYYEILPLGLEGNVINLGMVNPEDISALDYATRMLSYLKCSFQPQLIVSATHHAMLLAYLNYSNHKSKVPLNQIELEYSKVDRHEQPTLIVNAPNQLIFTDSDTKEHTPIKTEKTELNSVIELPPPPQSLAESPKINHLPEVEAQTRYLSEQIKLLANLSPKQMLQELLGRMLKGGIGRLYFDQNNNRGRILCSQDGVLQSILEGLDLSVLQGLINELKRIAHLSLIAVTQIKQVEIERHYRGERILLILRIIPGKNGEEATLQVLRGAALKFYQQQQLAKLGQDALSLAQQLQRKLNEIGNRNSINPTPLNTLPALHQLLDNLEQQFKDLRNSEFLTPNS